MVGLGVGVVELNSIGGGDEAESEVATEGNAEGTWPRARGDSLL